MDVSRPNLNEELADGLAELRRRLEVMTPEDRQREEERLMDLANGVVRGEPLPGGDIRGNACETDRGAS